MTLLIFKRYHIGDVMKSILINKISKLSRSRFGTLQNKKMPRTICLTFGTKIKTHELNQKLLASSKKKQSVHVDQKKNVSKISSYYYDVYIL